MALHVFRGHKKEKNNLPPITDCFFFHKLISIQDVRCSMFHFTCSATAAIALCSCIGELSPANDKNAELNIHLALV